MRGSSLLKVRRQEVDRINLDRLLDEVLFCPSARWRPSCWPRSRAPLDPAAELGDEVLVAGGQSFFEAMSYGKGDEHFGRGFAHGPAYVRVVDGLARLL